MDEIKTIVRSWIEAVAPTPTSKAILLLQLPSFLILLTTQAGESLALAIWIQQLPDWLLVYLSVLSISTLLITINLILHILYRKPAKTKKIPPKSLRKIPATQQQVLRCIVEKHAHVNLQYIQEECEILEAHVAQHALDELVSRELASRAGFGRGMRLPYYQVGTLFKPTPAGRKLVVDSGA